MAAAARRPPLPLLFLATYILAFLHGSSWYSASCPPCAGSAAWSTGLEALLLAARAQSGDEAVRKSLTALTSHAGGGPTDLGEVEAIGPAVMNPAGSAPRANRSSSERRVIAYSLYGATPKYCDGALRNAELVHTVFPGWIARFYVDARTVPSSIIAGLQQRGSEIVPVDTSKMRDQHMFWRFWVAADRTVDRFICRDVDSRLLARDFAAVSEWVQSGKPFHFERDHPSHSAYPISGGLWGGTRDAAPDMLELIASFPTDANYLSDMNFLNEKIWPRARAASLQHDAFSCLQFGARPFPMARSAEGEHVGQVFERDGRPRRADIELLLAAASPPSCRHPDDAPTPGNARATKRRSLTRPNARAVKLCQELKATYGIMPGSSWGGAPVSAQEEWGSLSCDFALARPFGDDALASTEGETLRPVGSKGGPRSSDRVEVFR